MEASPEKDQGEEERDNRKSYVEAHVKAGPNDSDGLFKCLINHDMSFCGADHGDVHFCLFYPTGTHRSSPSANALGFCL